MMRLLWIALALFSFGAAACSSDDCDENDDWCRCKAKHEMCLEQGGGPTISGLGLCICLFEASDAGRACAMSSECEGECIYTETSTGTCAAGTGRCSGNTVYYGCGCVAAENAPAAELLCAD